MEHLTTATFADNLNQQRLALEDTISQLTESCKDVYLSVRTNTPPEDGTPNLLADTRKHAAAAMAILQDLTDQIQRLENLSQLEPLIFKIHQLSRLRVHQREQADYLASDMRQKFGLNDPRLADSLEAIANMFRVQSHDADELKYLSESLVNRRGACNVLESPARRAAFQQTLEKLMSLATQMSESCSQTGEVFEAVRLQQVAVEAARDLSGLLSENAYVPLLGSLTRLVALCKWLPGCCVPWTAFAELKTLKEQIKAA